MDWSRATKIGLGVAAGCVAIALGFEGDAWLALLAGAGCVWLLMAEGPLAPEQMTEEYRGGGRGRTGPYARRHFEDGSTADTPSPSKAAMAEAGAARSRALAVLRVGPNPSAAEILAAHRRLMKTRHPDRGGTHASAAELNWARDLLLRQ